MKKILFMHQASSIGGGSYCLLNILKNIDRSKIEPIACLASEGPLKAEIESLGIEVVLFSEMRAIQYNKSLFNLHSIYSYYSISRSLPAFRRLLRQHHIDCVYLNNMMIYRYLKPAKECGCRTILHCREHWPLNEHRRQLAWAQKSVYMYADKLIAINRYSASMFPQKESIIIYDWIDMQSRFELMPMSEILGEDASGLKVYLYMGGIQKIKGCLEVVSTFSEHIRDKNARLLALGLTANLPATKFERLLSLFGLKSYYKKVNDYIKSDKRICCIPPTYNISHLIEQCYCNLSYFTIPHANLAPAECEIMGVPSVAACTDESLEYSFDGKMSCLYKINNIESFKEAIDNMDKHKSDFDHYLNSYSSTIADKFCKANNIALIRKAINDIIC